MIEFEPWSPVRGAQDGLDSTGQVYKEVAHQEKPTAQKACMVNQYPLDKPSPCLFISLYNFLQSTQQLPQTNYSLWQTRKENVHFFVCLKGWGALDIFGVFAQMILFVCTHVFTNVVNQVLARGQGRWK